MVIQVDCQSCGRSYRLSDDKAGKKFRCKDCDAIVAIPENDSEGGLWSDDFESSTPRRNQAPFETNEEDEDDWGDDYEDDWDEGDRDESNPWSAPRSTGSRKRRAHSSSARERVKIPAILMMIFAGITLLLQILSMIQNAITGVQEMNFQGMDETVFLALVMALGVLQLVIQVTIIIGANHMMNLESRGWALTAAILSCIPCCSCLCTGLPIGIWSLVLLNDYEVTKHFQS